MSKKRNHTEANLYPGQNSDEIIPPDSKRIKTENIQIVATNDEIQERINKFIETKQSNTEISGSREHTDIGSSSRTNPRSSHRPPSIRSADRFDAHPSDPRSAASYIPDQPDYAVHALQPTSVLPLGIPPLLEERIQVLENHLYTNISVRAVPADIYARLRRLEDRVLQLERKGIYPRNSETFSATLDPLASPPTTAGQSWPFGTVNPESVDDRIKELQASLASKSKKDAPANSEPTPAVV